MAARFPPRQLNRPVNRSGDFRQLAAGPRRRVAISPLYVPRRIAIKPLAVLEMPFGIQILAQLAGTTADDIVIDKFGVTRLGRRPSDDKHGNHGHLSKSKAQRPSETNHVDTRDVRTRRNCP